MIRRARGAGRDLDSTGAQFSATNTVEIRVAAHDQGVPKTNLIGSGEAWISSGGGTVHGTWSKSSATDPIHLVDGSEVAMSLAAGTTWIELVPSAGSVSFGAPVSLCSRR